MAKSWMDLIRKEVHGFSDKKILKKLSQRGVQNREGRQATYEEAISRGLIRKKKRKTQSSPFNIYKGLNIGFGGR